MFTHMTIRKMNLLGSLAIIVVLTATLGGFWIYAVHRSFQAQAEDLKSEFFRMRRELMHAQIEKLVEYIDFEKKRTDRRIREMLRQRVLEGYAIAMDTYRESRETKTEEDIRRLIIDRLKGIRFDNGRGYYFATTGVDAPELIADQAELAGPDIASAPGLTRETTVTDMIGFVTGKEEGFYRYDVLKPGHPESLTPKLSFIMYFEPFKWYIGTGVYLDDIRREVQKTVLERVYDIRYADNRFIYIFRYDGTVLWHRRTHFIARNILDMPDADGNAIYREVLDICLDRGSGNFEFFWKKPETEQRLPKICYAAAYPDWQWIITTDIYVDDIETVLQDKRSELTRQVRNTMGHITLVFLGSLVPALLLSRYFSAKLANEFQVFARFFRNAVAGRSTIDKKDCKFLEFQEVADLANDMIAEQKTAEEDLKRHRDHLEDLIGERTAELVVAKERAEAANQAKGVFLANMSHELRTPLNAILGYAQILKRQANLTDMQKQQLATVQSSGEHLLTLISDILDLSRIEALKMNTEEVEHCIEEAKAPVRGVIGYKGERKSILVVDDNPTNLAVLVSFLEPLGFDIDTADGGEKAIRMVAAAVPDLILMDLLMPGMDGDEALRQIRSSDRSRGVKIIGVSAAVADTVRKEAFAAACDDFVSKPVKIEMLLAKLKEQLHLEWIEDPVAEKATEGSAGMPALEATPVKQPPRHVLDEIIATMEMGDYTGVESILDRLMNEDLNYDGFCDTVREYVRRYDDEAILQYLSDAGK